MGRTENIGRIRLLLLGVIIAGALILNACSIFDADDLTEIIENAVQSENGVTSGITGNGGNYETTDNGGTLEIYQDGSSDSGTAITVLPSEGRAEAEASEAFADEYDERAAAIIDDAIWAALDNLVTVEYRNYSTEVVKSAVSYPFERYCERMENRTEKQSELFDYAYEKALNFEEFKIAEADYEGNLIIDGLTIATDWDYYDPYLNNYFTLDMLHGNDINSGYFDPEKDANFPVEPGTAEFDDMLDKMRVFDAVVERIVRKMPENLSTINKYYYLACVLSNQCYYSTREELSSKTVRNSTTAYGALIGGSAVCEGYSKAFLLLCEEADLFCEIISGIGGDEGHMWNLTQLETGTLNTDITWCDAYEPGSGKWFDYFMMSDDELEYFNHIRTEGHTATSPAIWN